ncbi:hypothetical protein LCGC14_0465760 [marine sediment metagenome]|uniref:Uncharacterized protein n=1 Tax=marine sediment metagenome TaxID=412755 RepID=A0A0F9SWK5_9ZZZZ
MVVIILDNKIRNVKLTGDEIEFLIATLNYQPHSMFPFFKKIIKQLKDAKSRRQEK